MGLLTPCGCWFLIYLAAIRGLVRDVVGAPTASIVEDANPRQWFYQHPGPRRAENFVHTAGCNPHTQHCDCLSWRRNTSACNPNIIDATGLPRLTLSLHRAGFPWWQPEGRYKCERCFCDVRWARQPDDQCDNHSSSELGWWSGDVAASEPPDIELYPIHGRVQPPVVRSGNSITVGAWLQRPTSAELRESARARHYFDVHAGSAPWADLSIGTIPVTEEDLRAMPNRYPRYVALLLLHRNCSSEAEASYLRELAALVVVHDAAGCASALGNPLFFGVVAVCGSRPPDDGWLPEMDRWQQCMLEHHAFFVASQPAADESSIAHELLLWTGIKAGSVPVLLPRGSNSPAGDNMTPTLPHPSAAVNALDFGSAAELAVYVASAQAEPSVWEAHQQWREEPFPADLTARLRNPPARLVCSACDYVAAHRHNCQRIVGALGSSIMLPICLRRLISDRHLPIVRGWAAGASQPTPSARLLPVYVASLSTAQDRHARLKQQLASAGLRASLVKGFDRDKLDSDTAGCWYPQIPFEGRSVMQERSTMGVGEVSLAAKHFVGYLDVFTSGHPQALFLEDDVVFDAATFHSSLQNATLALPVGWDMLFLGGCREKPPRAAKAAAAVHSQTGAWGSFGYLVSYEGAAKMLRSLPLRWPIDFQINAAVQELGLQVFCASELIVRHVEEGESLLAAERAVNPSGLDN